MRNNLTGIAMLLVIGASIGFLFYLLSRDKPPTPTVDVQVTSDPTDAYVYIGTKLIGATPTTMSLPVGVPTDYRVVAKEPYGDYKLYRDFFGTLTASEPTTISVWIDRTTAEEQAAARQAAEEARVRAEREQCLQRTSQTDIIIESWSWYKDSYAVAEGRVVNNTTATLRYVKAMIEYFTSSKTFITSDWTYLELTDLLPGQASPFKLYTNANPAMATASIRFVDTNGRQLVARERGALVCP